MAELVDALGSGPSGSNPVGVQVSFRVKLSFSKPRKNIYNNLTNRACYRQLYNPITSITRTKIQIIYTQTGKPESEKRDLVKILRKLVS